MSDAKSFVRDGTEVTCAGHCCAAFPIDADLDFLKSGRVIEGDLLGFMLRQLSPEQAAHRRAAAGSPLPIAPDRTYYRDYPGYGYNNTPCEHGCGLVCAGIGHTNAPLLCEAMD